VVLIGDAAHAVHPLAGQGLNLGMLDAAALVDCLGDESLTDVAGALKRFTRWRDSDNARAALMFEGLNDLFADAGPGMPWLRQVGMGLVQRLLPLRREFALHASGWVGTVPALARR
jgi:2-octaprenyl-6-methoxyphenol hydroxylase